MTGTGPLPQPQQPTIYIDDLADSAHADVDVEVAAETGRHRAGTAELINQIQAAKRLAADETEDPAIRQRARDWSKGADSVARTLLRALLAAVGLAFIVVGRTTKHAALAAVAHPIAATITGAAVLGTAVGGTWGALQPTPHTTPSHVAPAQTLPAPPLGKGTSAAPSAPAVTHPTAHPGVTYLAPSTPALTKGGGLPSAAAAAPPATSHAQAHSYGTTATSRPLVQSAQPYRQPFVWTDPSKVYAQTYPKTYLASPQVTSAPTTASSVPPSAVATSSPPTSEPPSEPTSPATSGATPTG